jgi:hypothetical protein
LGRWPRLGRCPEPVEGPLALADNPADGLDFSLPDLCRPEAPYVLCLGRLDESFVVYDHPQVIIFRRSETWND